MNKFTPQSNKEFWNDYAKKAKDNPHGAHSDYHIVELENKFIINELKSKKTFSLLDIGCGNGQRTLMFSKFTEGKVKGIDYSEEMINEAKKLHLMQDETIKSKLSFEIEDVNNLKDSYFDTIISCRCFINQPSENDQIKLFNTLYDKMAQNGSLIIAEQSMEGIQRLNKIRERFDLEPINIRWYNLPIKENIVFDKIKDLFNIKSINRLGTFYYISRVINPALSFPDEPKPNCKINEVGLKSEIIFQEMFGQNCTFEEFGAQLLVHFIKK